MTQIRVNSDSAEQLSLLQNIKHELIDNRENGIQPIFINMCDHQIVYITTFVDG